MVKKERNALIPLPAGTLENIGSDPKNILSGMVSDALALVRAREIGDMAHLREIAHDPHGFILRHGWVSLDFWEEAELKNLRRLLDTL